MPAPYVRGEKLRPAFSIRFTAADEQRIRERAKAEGRSPTELIRDATLAHVDAGGRDRGDTRHEETTT